MKDMASFLLKSLAANGKDINIDLTEEKNKVMLSTKLDAEDRGKIIGKDGCIINAVRIVLGAAGNKKGKKVSLKIED